MLKFEKKFTLADLIAIVGVSIVGAQLYLQSLDIASNSAEIQRIEDMTQALKETDTRLIAEEIERIKSITETLNNISELWRHTNSLSKLNREIYAGRESIVNTLFVDGYFTTSVILGYAKKYEESAGRDSELLSALFDLSSIVIEFISLSDSHSKKMQEIGAASDLRIGEIFSKYEPEIAIVLQKEEVEILEKELSESNIEFENKLAPLVERIKQARDSVKKLIEGAAN